MRGFVKRRRAWVRPAAWYLTGYNANGIWGLVESYPVSTPRSTKYIYKPALTPARIEPTTAMMVLVLSLGSLPMDSHN